MTGPLRAEGAQEDDSALRADPVVQPSFAEAGKLPQADESTSPAPVPLQAPPSAPPSSLRRFPVTYHEEASPLGFRVPARGRSPEDRARAATRELTEVLDEASEQGAPPSASVVVEGRRASVRIGNRVITALYVDDARAEGLELDEYAGELEAAFSSFLPTQVRRKSLQLFVLHVFLSVFFGVIGVLTLRGLRNAFHRWDGELDDKRGSLRPIVFLRVPIFSGEALASALAFALAVGRVVAYVTTVIATVVAILSQFEFTKPLLHRILRWSTGPVLAGVEAVVTAVPGLILAATMLVALRAALRVLHVLLDGVASRRVTWKGVPPERVSVFRIATTVSLAVVTAPLLIGAAFGRFGTPLETLALAVGGGLLLASVPLLANGLVGLSTLWRDNVRPGDWVQIGNVSGEVTQVSATELYLVPEGGGTIGVPMLYLLLHPLRRLRQSPEVSFEVTVARDRPAKELIVALRHAVEGVEAEAQVELVDLCRAWIKARISAPAVRAGVREQMLMAVADAVDRHEFELPTLHGPDR
ncbi:MAG: mechanosensitive ion channel domain-containing protein [Myxococcota bacterium]